MGKFKLTERKQEKKDETGTVTIAIRFSGAAGRGNLARCITLANCRVSDVYDAITKALIE